MCELFAMSSRDPATVTFSLRVFAEHGGGSAPHVDGWGVAFYAENDVRIVRDTACASRSPWVQFIAQQNLCSRLVMSHIRKATDGDVAVKNTQPFSRELGGRMHVFAHNGHVPSIRDHDEFVIESYQPIGDTDSEYAFCALLERLKALWGDRNVIPTLASRIEALKRFANDIGKIGLANFLYSDGDTLFAHGHRRKQSDGEFKAPGLFWLHRHCARQDPFADAAGVAVTSSTQDVVLVASVPLTTEDWEPFGEGDLAVVSNGKVVAIEQIESFMTAK